MRLPQLSLGCYGPEVKELQHQLERLGFHVGSSEVARSLFGPSTRAALEQWQRRHGLNATGVLDSDAYVVLMKARAGNRRRANSNPKQRSELDIAAPRNGGGSTATLPPGRTRRQADNLTVYDPNLTVYDPTVSVQITSPSNNDTLLGNGPSPVSIKGTVDVTTVLGTYSWGSQTVTVTIGNSPPQAASVSGSLDIYAGGQLTFDYQGTLPGGITPVQINAHASVAWQDEWAQGNIVGNVTTADATPITIEYNSTVTIDVQSPQDGQIISGSKNGITITATGTASSQVPLDRLEFSLDGNAWAPITPLTSPWSFPVPLTLGPHTLTFTVYDIYGHSQPEQLSVQVALAEDIFAADAISYLRALVEFATGPFNASTARITTDSSQSNNLTLDLIDQNFYRSIALIPDPVNNGKATETVKTLRVCIEVLRNYISVNSPSDAQLQRLTKEEGTVVAAAYRLLLNQLGTSYEELRMARMYDRNSPQDAKKLSAIADRLGIYLSAGRPDELDELFFDIGATPGSPSAVSESVLEQLFGFQDTKRDPFSQGATVGDSQQLIKRWILGGMGWNVTTDADGLAYLSIEKQLGFPYAVIYKDSARQIPLAAGLAASGTVQPLNKSGVSGQIVLNLSSTPPTLPYVASFSVFPKLLSWQKQRLRADWAMQDALLHPGPVLADPMRQITNWIISGVTLSKNTDTNGFIYVVVAQTPGPMYEVDLYSDAARTAQIATGRSPKPTATITLTEVNGSGVSGSITLNYQLDSTSIILAMLPNSSPAVDPDLLTDGDFVSLQSLAYSLYATRAGIVAKWISQLRTMREAAANQLMGLDDIFSSVLKDPEYYPNGMKSVDVIALDSNRQGGADISGVLTALSLELAAFNYLVQVSNFLNSPPPPPPLPTPELLDSEWDDIYSILSQVQKRRVMFSWIAEEQNPSIIVSPDYFSFPARLPNLFATGFDQDGQILADGAVDPHWSIIATPAGPTATDAYATISATSAWPIGQAWLRNSDASRWVSPQADESIGDAPGFYTYRTKIDLGGYDPASVWLVVRVAVDNALVGAGLNGTALPVSAVGFTSFTTFEVTGPFQAGINTLDLIIRNDVTQSNPSQPNPSGLRVELSFGEPPVVSALPSWRATVTDRSAWEIMLQGRINADSALESSLQSAVDETEKQTLPDLRDALLTAGCLVSQIPNLFSTGSNSTLTLGGWVDRDWEINFLNFQIPAFLAVPNAAWLPNDPNSKWIAPSRNQTLGIDPPGDYTFHTTFDLTGVDLTGVKVILDILVDDAVTDVLLNGQSLGLHVAGFSGFTASNSLSLTSGFVVGTNTLDIVVQNGPGNGSCGLRVAVTSRTSIFVDADWLSASLLMDVTPSSSQLTTRLDHATQMMQSLFFALRNNQFVQLSPAPSTASWTLTEALYTFDQEWVTMSTYGSWNALMLVFLYPETLLLPDLRVLAQAEPQAISEKTKEFVAFVSDLESASPLSPDIAVKKANTYASNLAAAGYANLPIELVGGQYADPRDIDLAALVSWAQPVMAGYWIARDWIKVAFLWEAWYSVAVQIGLELQKAQQFEAALGWFGSLYAYALPLAQTGAAWVDDNRKYFPGLLYEGTNNQYLQVPTWTITSATPHEIATTRAHPYARFMNLTIVNCLLDFADAQFTTYTPESISEARGLYRQALDLLSQLDAIWPADPVVARNPRLGALSAHAQSNLAKLQSGRNIAGLLTPIPQSSESLQPSQYRYSALIARAQQIVLLAQQAESAYLNAMQQGANEAYTALKAKQDLESANAAVKLENLKVTEANDQVSLAQDQANKSKIEVSNINDLLYSDIVDLEVKSVGLQWLQAGASIVSSLGTSTAGAAASAANSQASLEQKQIDWDAQREQAYNDQNIANNQITLAQDGVAIATQDLANANTEAQHASNIVGFLATKFTNVQLYQWMSGVLGSIYSYFLRQATAIARLAESQLAFERQQEASSIIQSDYWRPLDPNATQLANTNGLTGADLLLADITQLDQYALDTDNFKLQLTKTISLARLDPIAFQQFTQTGTLRFRTPMVLFDRDLPGHYLRLIKEIRVSVTALIPPDDGIKATLTNSGISRVVAADDSGTFRSVVVRRDPQIIALSSPSNATGVFDLTAQPTMLLPFEDLGVDTSWEFIMPRASNQFDFSTISDVLLSIDYTALDSQNYRARVIQELDQNVSADCAYSFRQQFADAWYYLNNPNQSPTPMVVQFQTETQDFPPNIEELTIQQLVMYFAPVDDSDLPVQPTAVLTFAGIDSYGNPESPQGTETAIENFISTRRTNDPTGWTQMIGMQVSGTWTLDLSDQETSDLFQNNQIQDILFVITYKGLLPAWPSY
jgi:peptidoglycan hydrolase-like protein with peptidoglycan-binding domain